MKYSIIILITLTSLVFSRIINLRAQNKKDYSMILENLKLKKGFRFDFSLNRDYKSVISNHNQIPKKVKDWIKIANPYYDHVKDIDLIYDPSVGGRVKGEIYKLAKYRTKISFIYAFVESALPPNRVFKRVCKIILNMQKCKNEFVSPIITKEQLKIEIYNKMNYLLNKDYKVILNPPPK
jgi:hypothetical protein